MKKGLIIPITSPTERAKSTADTALKTMNKLPDVKVRKSAIIYSLLGGAPDFSGVEKLFYQKVKGEGRSPEDFCKKFWNNELEIKPEIVTKNFINKLGMVFKNSIKRNRKNTIISFRHGDKNKEGNLTEKGKEQAQKLGVDLKKEIDNEGATILAATHNVINETIIHTIFSGEELPKEWDELLDFTESVKYTFYPKKGEKEPYLEVDWRGYKKQISYEKFEKLIEKINNQASKDL